MKHFTDPTGFFRAVGAWAARYSYALCGDLTLLAKQQITGYLRSVTLDDGEGFPLLSIFALTTRRKGDNIRLVVIYQDPEEAATNACDLLLDGASDGEVEVLNELSGLKMRDDVLVDGVSLEVPTIELYRYLHAVPAPTPAVPTTEEA